jgi:hypothetical protein
MKLTNKQLKVISVAFNPEKTHLIEKKLSDEATWLLAEEVLAAREMRAMLHPKLKEIGSYAGLDSALKEYDKVSAWNDD